MILVIGLNGGQIIKFYIECFKIKQSMGNHIPSGIPIPLAKNWQPVPDHPNSFRNKLTSEYTHKHIINIEHPMEIQSFKWRMKQTNPYICRVLFYHQYHESIYHVYTDEIHIQPTITRPELWRLEKIKIMDSFAQLAHAYGYMKVCRTMIGSDSNQHIKIWIHPDPVSAKAWSPCNSELIMLNDILSILQGIQEKLGQKEKKILDRCLISNSQIDYTSFDQYLRLQTQIFQAEEAQARSKPQRGSSIIENFQINPGKQSHHDVGGHQRKNLNKTYAFPSQIHDVKNAEHYQKEPRLSNDEYGAHYAKNNKLQKLFNPVQCETSRQDSHKDQKKSRQHLHTNPFNNSRGYQNNLSLERPTTYYHDSNARSNYYDENFKTLGTSNSPPKRRETENFKLLQNIKEGGVLNKKEDSSKSSIYLKPKAPEPKIHQAPAFSNKNQLSKLLNKVVIPNSPQNADQRLSKTYQTPLNLNPNNPQNNNSKSRPKISPYRKEYKQTSIPNFLIKSSELEKDQNDSKMVYDKHPSTERQQREIKYKEEVYLNQIQKTGLNIISAKSIGESSDGGHAEKSESRSRNNTVAMLKEELNFILESPIEAQKRPVSLDYQNFKSKKLLYRPSELEFESEEAKDQVDIIKQKVEEKKMKFAQLKTDARKILEDDF